MASVLGVNRRFQVRSPEELTMITDDHTWRRRKDTGQMGWVLNPGAIGEQVPPANVTNLNQSFSGSIDSMGFENIQQEKKQEKYVYMYYSTGWYWSSHAKTYDKKIEAGVYFYVKESEQYDSGIADGMLSNAMQSNSWLQGACTTEYVDKTTPELRDVEYQAGGLQGFSNSRIDDTKFKTARFVLIYDGKEVDNYPIPNGYAY